jgi:beta-aspartyl-peptidase (threonine type)
LLHGSLRQLGGTGGIIAVDRGGRIVTDFSTEGMFRGARDSGGLRQIDIY